MDVLSVSCKQLADLSPWHGVFHKQASLLQILIGALIEFGIKIWSKRRDVVNCAPLLVRIPGA
jgi:hypothetical protein